MSSSRGNICTNSSRIISAMTREGIRSLQEGRYVYAILCFRHALESLKSETAATQNTEETPSTCTGAATATACRGWPHDDRTNYSNNKKEPLAIKNVPIVVPDPSSLQLHSPHNVFDVYGYAFVYPNKVVCRTQQQQQDGLKDVQVELSSVLLYNLALAHLYAGLYGTCHEESRHHLEEARFSFKTALLLFHFSSETTTTANGNGNSNDTATTTTTTTLTTSYFQQGMEALFLAILNNLGFLFHHFGQLQGAWCCSNLLEQLLVTPAVMVLADETQEFFKAAVIHTKDFVASAAAAA